MPRILIVEDEPDIVFGLQEDLRRQGYDTSVVSDGDEAILRGAEGWDLILLDVMLPGADGFEVCTTLRNAGVRTPIILLTARAREAEKERGLDAGADDYVTKPFSLRELRARIRAQLRRSTEIAGTSNAAPVRFGEWELDVARAQLRRAGAIVEITPQEFRLLQVFLRNVGRVLTRAQLIDAAWGQGMAITDRAVDTHVFNLRKKIEQDPADPRFIISARGLGYRFET